MLLHVVADYGHNDLAFAEVAQRLAVELPEIRLLCTVVPPFATLSAGFCVAQLALNAGPEALTVFHNVAPRRDDRSARHDNAGERLVCARLPSGRLVIGPNSGYSFSFVKPAAETLDFVRVPSSGSQFRSRDIFAAAVARLVNGDTAMLAEPVPDEAVPPPPESRLAYVDGYGNMKTTIAHPDCPSGSRVTIRIGEQQREAVVAGGGFAVADGQLAFAPGSSGWRTSDGDEIRFHELFLRGGNAWEEFGGPPPESVIELIGRHGERSAVTK